MCFISKLQFVKCGFQVAWIFCCSQFFWNFDSEKWIVWPILVCGYFCKLFRLNNFLALTFWCILLYFGMGFHFWEFVGCRILGYILSRYLYRFGSYRMIRSFCSSNLVWIFCFLEFLCIIICLSSYLKKIYFVKEFV